MKENRSNKLFGVLGVIANFSLAKLAPASSIRRLVKALDSTSEDTATAAYMALVKLGPKYAKEVLKACREPSPDVIQVLGDMGDVTVIPALELFAKEDRLAEIARESIETLQAINDQR
jgi:HEAT repeat protein